MIYLRQTSFSAICSAVTNKMSSLRCGSYYFKNPLTGKYLDGQNIYISLHPQKGNSIDFLLTVSVSKDFQPEILDQLAKQPKNGMLVNSIDIEGKQGYVIYVNDLKKRFYLLTKNDHSLSGSALKGTQRKKFKI